jgi:hypothetical protein
MGKWHCVEWYRDTGSPVVENYEVAFPCVCGEHIILDRNKVVFACPNCGKLFRFIVIVETDDAV